MTMRPLCVRAAVAALLLIGAAAPSQAQRVRSRVDTTFAFSNTGRVDVSLGAGDIRVIAWARNDARIVATSERGDIATTISPSRLRLELRGRGTGAGRTQFEIHVPIGVRVSASARTGSVSINGTRGPVSVSTSSGTVSLSDIAGDNEIETFSAPVVIQRASGSTRIAAVGGVVTINEVSGDLNIDGVSVRTTVTAGDVSNLSFDAANGRLDYAGVLSATGRHSIETFNGDVTLRFPANFGASLELESLNGKLNSPDFPVTLGPTTTRDGDRQLFTINGGGARIMIETLNGGVTLLRLASTERR